jgi:hypothetical protein
MLRKMLVAPSSFSSVDTRYPLNGPIEMLLHADCEVMTAPDVEWMSEVRVEEVWLAPGVPLNASCARRTTPPLSSVLTPML